MRDCRACGIRHASEDEAEAMHDATESVHLWFKEKVLSALMPIQAGAIRKAETAVKNPIIWDKPGRKEFI